MRPLPPKIRRTIPPEPALPRYELSSVSALDSSEVKATVERRYTRPSIPYMRPYRPVQPPRADSTADVAVEDILLEADLDDGPVTRPRLPREESVEVFRRATFGVPPSFVPGLAPPAPPRPSEQAQVDALLQRHEEIPVEVEVPSIAPVALATSGNVNVFPLVLSVPPPPIKRSGGAVAFAVALVALLVVAGGAAAAFLERPEWGARVKGIASDLVGRAFAGKKSEPAAVATSTPAPEPPPTTVVAPPPPPPATPAVDPSATLVTLPPYAKGHRVFVDGVVVATSAPADGPVTMKCGRHVVRIGTTGRVRGVNLPCGGAITLR